ncbi:MAG: hypothetical protein K6E10_09730 [Eubacterium sp.]|nr:hypothetical protein [Eubacterium sp.]
MKDRVRKKQNVLKLVFCVVLALFMCLQNVKSVFAAGTWMSDANGWWYSNSDGSYPAGQWMEIDGYWYYFLANGYMDSNGYRDGCWLNSDGSWNTAYSGGYWASNSTGWWYTDASGWYPVSTWLRINGSYYYFKADGYMAVNEWVDGCYLGSDGAWVEGKKKSSGKVPDANAASEKFVLDNNAAEGWQIAYNNKRIEVLKNGELTWDGSVKQDPYGYFVYDIDNSGIPELYIKYGTCEADYSLCVYDYVDGAAKMIRSTGSGHVSYYSIPGNGMITYWGHMGAYSIAKVTYDGTNWNTEGIASESNVEVYKEPSDFEPEAKNLTLINMNNPLGIFAFDVEPLSTASTKGNDFAKSQINNAINNNGEVYVAYTSSYGDKENLGKIKFNSMLLKGGLSKYNKYSVASTSWGDLNGDGQDECLVILKYKTSYDCVVLSYQGDTVYAYFTNYINSDAKIVNQAIQYTQSYDKSTAYRDIRFYKDLAYVEYPY